jgi:signal transduction histidine kinase
MNQPRSIRQAARRQAILLWSRCLAGGLAFLFLAPGVAASEASARPLPSLTNCIQILKLSPQEAQRHFPIHLEGVVTYADAIDGIVILQDATGACQLPLDVKRYPVKAGDRAILTGVTSGIGVHRFDVARYPDHPSGRDYVNSFEGPTNWGNHYVSRLRGFLHPPQTGPYSFWIAGDDIALLLMSSDDDPQKARIIAGTGTYTLHRGWDHFPSQASISIPLEAGRRYYVEALHQEVGWDDHLSVAWEGPGITRAVIEGKYLSPWSEINQQTSRGTLLREYWRDFLVMDLEELAPEQHNQAPWSARTSVKVIGPNPMPEPQRIRLAEPIAPVTNWSWTLFDGVVSFASEVDNRLRLDLTQGSLSLQAYVLLGGKKPPYLRNQQVRVSGACQLASDERSNRVLAGLWIPGLEFVRVLGPAPEDWREHPGISVGDLFKTNVSALVGQRVHVQGIVVDQNPGKTLMLADEAAARVRVVSSQTNRVPLSARVEAIGFLSVDQNLPVLSEAFYQEVNNLGQTVPLSPYELPGDRPQVLTTIEQIKALSLEQALQKCPAQLRAVVIYVLPFSTAAIIQDATGGMYINQTNNIRGLLAGQYIEVEGYSEMGDFAPYLVVNRVTLLGDGKLPEPSRVPLDYLMTGRKENTWVEQDGVIRSVSIDTNLNSLNLEVMGVGAPFPVRVFDPRLRPFPTQWKVDTAVRIRGSCSAISNQRRQHVGFRLDVPLAEEIEILRPAPADPFSIAVQAVTNLMQWTGARTLIHRVKIQGTVTLRFSQQTFFLQDHTGAASVRTLQPVTLKPGDQVEVVGFPESRGRSAGLSDALVRVIGQGPVPPAQTATVNDLLAGQYDSFLVRVNARLLYQELRGGRHHLELQADQRLFNATLETNQGALPAIAPGSLIALVGVCSLTVDANRNPQSFELLLNSPASISVLDQPSWWTLRHTLTVVGGLGVVLLAALTWIGMLRRQVDERTHQLSLEIEEHKRTETKLEEKTSLLETEMEERERVQAEVERVHRQLLTTSRQAGMAEMATGVLHNVGNALNSVNVSATLLEDRMRRFRTSSLAKAVDLLESHQHDLGHFLTQDEKGRQLPDFLKQLNGHLASERDAFLEELDALTKNVDHIKQIVAMQQSYAKVAGVVEIVTPQELVEDALRIHSKALVRHNITLAQDYQPAPSITVDKHKVLQILVNLFHNAKYACDSGPDPSKLITVRISQDTKDRVKIMVIDNGVGIAPENMTRVFSHGFTTRKGGHGFGLHNGAIAARELGGSLTAHSQGLGKGATFILELPLHPPQAET